jgi:hypothetical protein
MIGNGEYPELEPWKSWYRGQLPSIPVATPAATLIRPGHGLPRCFVVESAQAVTSPQKRQDDLGSTSRMQR